MAIRNLELRRISETLRENLKELHVEAAITGSELDKIGVLNEVICDTYSELTSIMIKAYKDETGMKISQHGVTRLHEILIRLKGAEPKDKPVG